MTEPDDDPWKIADHMVEQHSLEPYKEQQLRIVKGVLTAIAWFSVSGGVGLYASRYGTDVLSGVGIGVVVTLFVFSAGALLLNAVFDG